MLISALDQRGHVLHRRITVTIFNTNLKIRRRLKATFQSSKSQAEEKVLVLTFTVCVSVYKCVCKAVICVSMVASYHLIVEIGSVEGCCDCHRLSDTQDLLTVLEDAAGGCGREANQRDFRKLSLQDAQQFIIYAQTGSHLRVT